MVVICCSSQWQHYNDYCDYDYDSDDDCDLDCIYKGSSSLHYATFWGPVFWKGAVLFLGPKKETRIWRTTYKKPHQRAVEPRKGASLVAREGAVDVECSICMLVPGNG